MLRLLLSGGLLACPVLLLAAPHQDGAITPKQVIKLFNGKDLTNFYTFNKGTGKNNDPEKVFTVHDGTIHISGKVDGGITTEKEYTNYRIVVEFKWGEKTWPPREGKGMDSGLFLHCTGEDGVAGAAYPAAYEFQIWQGAVGDFILIPGKDLYALTVEGEKRSIYMSYKPGSPALERKAGVGKLDMISRLGKDPAWKNVQGFRGKDDIEKPHGEWNTIEAICDKDTITNIVNGKVVNKGTKANFTKGKILLQSEGAEIYFRKVELHPLN